MIVDESCKEIPQEILDFYESVKIDQIYLATDNDREFIIAVRNKTQTYLGFIDELNQRQYYYYTNTFSEEKMLKLIKLKAFL